MRRIVSLFALILTTCSPPQPMKTTTATVGGGGGVVAPPAPVADANLDTLTEGAKVRGFTAVALYLDDADKPLGARFTHDATGFTFDYLRIETAPQGFIWVNSFPTGDKGEPHTQEHLLLGKGDRGRKLGSFEAMALAESSAFTDQWRTAYHFHTVAGPSVFWPVFEDQLDALLNPDYSDEEIRREVRNFGVDKADDGTLHLEEKGTVYNEMVRTYESPEVNLWREAGHLVYGPKHPLVLDSGGYPPAIRDMTPQDIRAFHESAYHLANMGMIAAFPTSMSLASVLDETSKILVKEAGRKGRVMSEADLPKPTPAAAGTVKVVDYPYATATNPGPMMFAWPASRDLDDTERVLMGLFLDSFAGDESTTLYKQLIDSKTRKMDLGASDVWSYTKTDQGQPVYLGLSGVKADKLEAKTVSDVRALIAAELERIAKLPDGDPELVAFDARVQSRVIDLRRRLAKFLDSPPGFGIRGTGSGWNDHLHQLSKSKGFKKSLTLRPALAQVEQILAGKGNPWRERLKTWGLLETPFGIAAKPSPELRKQLDDERKARADAELARLQKQYAAKDAAATLAKYATDYDAETKRMEAAEGANQLPPLVDSPPMTLDDSLKYETDAVASVPRFTATFDAMVSSRVQLAFRIGAIADKDQVFLAALPSLLSDAGVIENGTPIPADEMKERQRKEILELSVYYVDNPKSGRIELVAAGAGNGAGETKAAIGWLHRVLLSPDWRPENLARLRDVIDQRLTGIRQRMLGAEEGWVENPRDAWRVGTALYGHTSSFLTRAHDLHRIRWMLADPGEAAATKEVVKFLGTLGGAKSLKRDQLAALTDALAKDTKPKDAKLASYVAAAGKLSAKAKPLALMAGKDLAAMLGDLPDSSLAADWTYLCKQMAADLQVGAPAALARLESVRKAVVDGGGARIVEVGSKANQQAIASDVQKLVGALPKQKQAAAPAATGNVFRDRLAARDPKAKTATFVGLFAPSTSSGVFVNLAPNGYFGDASDDSVMDYLASNLYTGHGAHSIFMKTWAAGLAYSNGMRRDLEEGTVLYYAERCPLLPQTLRFVIDQLKKGSKPDANIARYAVAKAFEARVANGFEQRASAMASNLVDGLTPDVQKAFREKVIAASKDPQLADKLFGRMEKVYSKVLPGYGSLDPKAIYFVIGPDKQLTAYQEYLRAAVGKDATLHRLYPRDFWIPATL
ncbi:MAG TPA: hypothetical protein VMZ53_17745 [Kofleriaceae bacterium]|nr:hypothetical protein [Kofleriaceae bacterium]